MKKVLMVIGLLVCALMLSVFERNAIAEEKLDLRRLRLLAKKLEAPITSRDERAEKQATDEFAALTPAEVFELRKIHRKAYWPRYARKMNKKQVFAAMEKIDKILFQMIEERFGLEATLYNLPKEQMHIVIDEVLNSEEIKPLIDKIENGLKCKRCSSGNGRTEQGKVGILAGTCDYVTNWPTWVPYVKSDRGGYRGYACDRVRNGADDWRCDFRLYIDSRNYKEVDGYSYAGRCTAWFHRGLNGSSNKDRFIVGFWSVVLCGNPPSESWVKRSLIFRE